MYVYFPFLSSSFYFKFENESYHYGIKTYRYSMPSEELDRRYIDRGFFPDGPSGVFNLSAVEEFGELLPVHRSSVHLPSSVHTLHAWGIVPYTLHP